jgi:hypothetical protein
MTEAQEYFHLIGKAVKGGNPAKTFGHESYAIGKKPFMFLHDDDVAVFKLTGKLNEEAMSLKGAEFFNPMKKGKGMSNWVVLSYKHKAHWEFYAKEAFKIVKKEAGPK